MKNKLRKIKNKVAIIMAALINLMITVPVYAAPNIEELKLFTGTKALLVAIGAIVTALTLAGCGVWCSIKAGAWMTADDDEKKAKKKAFITTIIISVVAVCTPGSITWVLAFYM